MIRIRRSLYCLRPGGISLRYARRPLGSGRPLGSEAPGSGRSLGSGRSRIPLSSHRSGWPGRSCRSGLSRLAYIRHQHPAGVGVGWVAERGDEHRSVIGRAVVVHHVIRVIKSRSGPHSREVEALTVGAVGSGRSLRPRHTEWALRPSGSGLSLRALHPRHTRWPLRALWPLRSGWAGHRNLQFRLMAGVNSFLAVKGHGSSCSRECQLQSVIGNAAVRPTGYQRRDVNQHELVQAGSCKGDGMAARGRRAPAGERCCRSVRSRPSRG